MSSTDKEKYINLWQAWIQALENNSLLDKHNKELLLLSGITTAEFQKLTLFTLPQ